MSEFRQPPKARRHLSESQRASAAAKIANMKRSDTLRQNRSANLPIGKTTVSQADAASMLNVSERSVRTARKVQDDGSDVLIEEVDAGHVSVSAAAEIAKLPHDEQERVIARGEAEILAKAKEIRKQKNAERRDARVAKIAAMSAVVVDFAGTINRA